MYEWSGVWWNFQLCFSTIQAPRGVCVWRLGVVLSPHFSVPSEHQLHQHPTRPLLQHPTRPRPLLQVPTINRTDQTSDWFSSLHRCFGWSERIEQKPLPPPPRGMPSMSAINGHLHSPGSQANNTPPNSNGAALNGNNGSAPGAGLKSSPSPVPEGNGGSGGGPRTVAVTSELVG